jgi:hypothetical protein
LTAHDASAKIDDNQSETLTGQHPAKGVINCVANEIRQRRTNI